eukprot:m.91647 g.91647  ORF g.91647 m.91647 type:complete len:447 (+) comp8877_c0_seq6:158-1498(+)
MNYFVHSHTVIHFTSTQTTHTAQTAQTAPPLPTLPTTTHHHLRHPHHPFRSFFNFHLKWVEIKRDINFSDFKSGKQLLARNPKISVLTSKGKLVDTLRAYDRSRSRTSTSLSSSYPSSLKMDDFFFKTFKLNDSKDRKAFVAAAKADPKQIWINKPVGRNQGKGITLVTDSELFLKELQEEDKKASVRKSGMERIIQSYLPNPLLLNGRKADIRCYMFIANNTPSLVMYHDGYIRLSLSDYSDDYSNLGSHLTNQYVQKKNEDYASLMDESTWSMNQLDVYLQSDEGINAVNESARPKLQDPTYKMEEGGQQTWVASFLVPRMKEIMIHCYKAARVFLEKDVGYFDVLGFDFIIDDMLNVWLIEINVNPALHIRTQACKSVIPTMISSVLDIMLFLFDQFLEKKKLTSVPKHLGDFQILQNDISQNKKPQRTKNKREEKETSTKEK